MWQPVGAIQRETGIKVIYVNAGDETRQYAEIAGLKAEFHGYLEYHIFVRLAARARLGVDMYALHGFGRNELTFAYAGTPCIGSTYTQGGLENFDPWNPLAVLETAKEWIENTRYITQFSGSQSVRRGVYDIDREAGVQEAEDRYGFDAARRQMTDTLERLETWRLQPSN